MAAIASTLLLATTPSAVAAEPVDGPRAAGDGAPIVIGRSFPLASKTLEDVRTITVHLPAHYSDSSRHFPVLFLLDGGEHEDFHHITGLTEITAAYAGGAELIVVGIEGVDRRRDLTSPTHTPADLSVAPTSGGAERYRRFLTEELKPWVAARYRTSGRTALMGESLAGLFTLETLLTSPRSFDDYIIVSPSLWWDRGALAGRAAASLHEASDYQGRRAWVAFENFSGPDSHAALAQQEKVKRALAEAHLPGFYWKVVRPGESHATIYHPAALLALRDLYGPPTKPTR